MTFSIGAFVKRISEETRRNCSLFRDINLTQNLQMYVYIKVLLSPKEISTK